MGNLEDIKKLQDGIDYRNGKMNDWMLYDEWLKKVDSSTMTRWERVKMFPMSVAYGNRVNREKENIRRMQSEQTLKIEEEKVKFDVDLKEDLEKPMREAKLNNLLAQQKEIKEGIDNARQSMQDGWRAGGFRGRIKGFFYTIVHTVREGMNREKLIELSKSIQFEKEELKRVEEKNKTRRAPDKQRDTGAEKGDLEYHQYEGRGLEARHHSEMFDVEKTEMEKGSFQESVLARVKEDLDREGQELQKMKNEMDREESDSLKQYMALISGKTEWEINRMNDMERNLLRENAVKYREQSIGAQEQLEWSKNMIKNQTQLDKADKRRISHLESDEKSSRKLIEKKQAQLNKMDKDIDRMSLDALGWEALKNRAEQDFQEKVESCKNKDKITYKEFRELSKLQSNLEKTNATYEKMNAKYQAAKEERESLKIDIKSLEERIEDNIREREELKSARKEREFKMETITSANKELKTLSEKETKRSRSLLQRTLQRRRERQELEQKIAQNQQAKENAEHDVLNADVSSFLINNSIHDTVQGISVNGKVYLDQKEAERKGIKGAESKINEAEKKRLIETQKIVNAIKSRPIFKFLNSETISEYLTYDEEKADFELADPNASPEEKKQYELNMRKKYFQNDAIFTHNQIKVNKYWASNTARDMNIASYKKLLKDSLLQTGTSFLGLDSILAVGSDGKLDSVAIDDKKMTGVADDKKVNHVVGGALPLASMGLMGVDLSLGLAGISHTALERGSFSVTGEGLASTVMALAQQIHTITTAKVEQAGQKSQQEANLKQGLVRLAQVMNGAMAQNSRKVVEASVEMSKIIAKNALMYGHGWGTVAGIGLTIANVIVGTIAKKAISAFVTGKADNELIDSPDVLGGINYDKNVISDKEFDKILASVTGIGSKAELKTAMRIMDGIDLHRSAQNSLKKTNIAVDKNMAALGFGDKRKYNKINVENILKKTSNIKENWRDTLKGTIEVKGIDYDDTSTMKKKIASGNHVMGKSARLSRQANTFYKQQKIIKGQETRKSDSHLTDVERGIAIASKDIAKNLYDVHMNRMKMDEQKGIDVNRQAFENPENRQKLILLMSKTNVVKNLAMNGSGSIDEKDMPQIASQAMQEAAEIAKLEAGQHNPENAIDKSKDYQLSQGMGLADK